MSTVLLLILAITLSPSSVCYAEELPWHGFNDFPIESKEAGKPPAFVGMLDLYYPAYMDVVLYSISPGLNSVYAIPLVLTTVGTPTHFGSIYRIESETQLGVHVTTVFDFGRKGVPGITILMENGQTYGNISEKGIELKKKYLPYVYFGPSSLSW